ncbi:MAG: flagellin, partial [Candidatus Poribacteria bacterium]|nr:flagellin [Candidatus Poribacteria bacterium]
LLQTAEGGLNEIGNILGRMRELAVQSASDTVSGSDRDSIDLEFDQLGSEITRIAKSTEYNGISLLDGSQNTTDDNSKTITLQIGADNSSNDQLDINLGDFTLGTSYDNSNFGGVGASGGIGGFDLSDAANKFNLDDAGDAQTTIDTLDSMIEQVNDARADIGAKQNRLEFTSSNLMSSIQNNSASVSTIRDADFAAEAADLAKNQILVQSGTSMLAQANGLSQNVLALIR